MRSLLISVAIAYAVIVVGMYLLQRKLMYFPDPHRPAPAAFGVPTMQPVRVPTADGLDLLAWWSAPARPEAPVVLFLHGNAGHIGVRAFKVKPYLDRGWGVLLLAWRGYSGNAGSPTEDGLYEDGRAALRFLDRQGIAADRLALYGESLGSGTAVQLATETRVGALALEAPFSSIADVARKRFFYLPVSLLLRDRFESIRKIGRVTAPVLVVHGVRDGVVPVEYGRRLFEAANEPKSGHFLERAAHNDLYEHGTGEIVIDFLEKVFAGK